ncbi:hypothetical protein ACJ41O_010540 [Fusarium nematophilum]
MASGSMQALVLNPKDRTVTVQDVSVPVPGPRQILIKVKAVALNPVDVMNVDNPIATQELRIVGSDFAGIVTQVGADFAGDDPRARAGARVAGFVQGGAFAGYVVADYDLTWIIPAAMPFESAATVSLTALTAAQGLFYRLGFPCPFYTAPAGSQPNDEPVNVLINGAAGQVGTFAAQLARLAEGVVAKKIRLIGTASASKHALLRQEPFSYDLLVDYRDPDWVGKVDEATEGSGILYGIDAASIGSSVASVESTLCPTGKFAVYRSPAAGGFDLSGLKIKPVIGIVWEGLGVEIGYHDIIAIHGLGGYGSWQHESSLWLRDFLPVDLPSARIFTYSYRCSAFCDSWTIFDGARKLLEKLKNLQADNAEASRPLIFICHSLGGLVLKCALTEAFQNRGHEALDEIITATQGIIFLGTPYSTSSSELYTNISRITAANEATEVTMVAARAMRQIVIGFMNLPWASLPWSIASFYEAQNLPGTDLRQAVDPSQTESWAFPQDMCRFTSNHDGSYVKVLQALRDIIHSSSGSITDQVTLSPTLSPAEHVASFFFSHHGANQSVTSLLRSLLYQLLKSVASSRTFEIFSRLTEIGEVLGSDRSWDDDVLTDSLLRLVDKSTALGDSLSFFIDALDECDDPDRVVSLFRRLSSFGPARGIRACLSSRQSPHFTPVAEIRMEEHNFIDIQTYLNDKLVALRTRSASTLDVRQVSEAMAEKSRGGFVWAALVASKLIHDACLEPIEAAHVSGTE